MTLNDEINNAKEASKKASEVHSAAKQKTIEMGDRFYNIKKKADTFKDSISKVEENLNAKKPYMMSILMRLINHRIR